MRTAQRNGSKIYYSLYKSKTPILDEYGNNTGEFNITYYEPVEFHLSVSAARGTADVEQFGINLNYNKTMVTHDMTCPIAESTRLWIDKEAVIDNVEQPYNYVVVSVARSINSITYAIREVTVT